MVVSCLFSVISALVGGVMVVELYAKRLLATQQVMDLRA